MKTNDNKHKKIQIFSVFQEKISSLFKPIRHNFLVFLFFLGLSILAWLLRALSDTYDAEIKYPVVYTNLPPNRILTQAPPEKLLLTVRTDGFTILSTKLIFKPPLKYNVNAFSMYSLTMDSTSVYTLTRYARERLSIELNKRKNNIEILDINPDTLFFNFSRVKRKKIPVLAIIDNQNNIFAQQHMLNGLIYTVPDSVEITGPSSVVDTMRYMPTKTVYFKDLSDTAEKNIQIDKHSKLIYATNKVKVIVPVDEFTESEFTIPVIQRGVPDSIILKTFPKSVKVKYITTLTNFDKITSDIFHAYVYYPDIDIETSSKIPIRLDSIPLYIHNAHITPRNAEFLIERKHVENRSNRGDR